MFRKRKKLSLVCLFMMSAILGVAGGTGIASADVLLQDLSSGTQYYYNYHYETDPYYGLSWDWFQRNYIYRSADSTTVTCNNGNPGGTYYYSGWSNVPDDIVFGTTVISDEMSNHQVVVGWWTGGGFDSLTVDGVDHFATGLYYTYTGFSSSDNYLDIWQHVNYWSPGEGLVNVDIALTGFYTGIGTRR